MHKNIPAGYFTVAPGGFNGNPPNNVAAGEWEVGLGCIGSVSGACSTGDSEDTQNTGMYLAKSGLSTDNAAGFASITHLGHPAPLEFGYDIRNGGHCGAGAPRFNVLTNDNVNHFIGCNSPPPTSAVTDGIGWTRLRWGDMANNIMPPAFPDFLPGNTIVSVTIIFDEGVDTGPDFSGDVILDNIDINTVMVGRQKCTVGPMCT